MKHFKNFWINLHNLKAIFFQSFKFNFEMRLSEGYQLDKVASLLLPCGAAVKTNPAPVRHPYTTSPVEIIKQILYIIIIVNVKKKHLWIVRIRQHPGVLPTKSLIRLCPWPIWGFMAEL